MKKYPLIGVSIIAVVLLVLGSLTNVIGYQTVQSSNQKVINDEVDQKELLFQTILDIANNKEIQKVILGSEITGKRFFDTGVRFSVFPPPVLTEKFLKHAYTMGVILTKTISKSKIHSMLEQYQISNQGVQREISAVVERDAKLKEEITQLSDLKCDCNNNSEIGWYYYPLIICATLFFILLFANFIYYFFIELSDIVGPYYSYIFLIPANIILIITYPLMFIFELLQCLPYYQFFQENIH